MKNIEIKCLDGKTEVYFDGVKEDNVSYVKFEQKENNKPVLVIDSNCAVTVFMI